MTIKILSVGMVLAALLAIVPSGFSEEQTPQTSETTQSQTSNTQVAQLATPEASPLAPVDGMLRQISLDLRGIDVVDALKFLAVKGDLNVVTTRSVSGQVNLFLQQVTIKDALDIILLTNSLALENRNGILTVMTEQEYEALHGNRYHDQRQVKTIPLRYANAPRVASLLDGVRSSIGRIIADETTGTLVIVDVPERLEQTESAIRMLDMQTVVRPAPTVTEVFPLKYNTVENIQASVSSALTPSIGTMQVDKKSNTMVISDLPYHMPTIRKIIEAFDQKTPQVFIEARILQVTLTDEFNAGVEWETIFKDPWLNRLTLQSSLASSITNFGKLAIGTIGSDHLGVTIKALQRFGKTDVLSTPHIAALNDQEATIHVGTKEVYVTTSTSQGTSTSTTSESVNFIDVGIKLKVTPHINDDGFVSMKIVPEVSSVSRTVTTAQGNAIPVIETATAETSVMIKDGTTIVMGGLIKDSVSRVTNQIPLLGSIPVLGSVFRSKDDEDVKTELIVFLTPYIISGEHPVGSLEPREAKDLKEIVE